MRRFTIIIIVWLVAVALLWQADTVQIAQITPQRATHTPLATVVALPTWTPGPAYPAPDPAYPAPARRDAPRQEGKRRGSH